MGLVLKYKKKALVSMKQNMLICCFSSIVVSFHSIDGPATDDDDDDGNSSSHTLILINNTKRDYKLEKINKYQVEEPSLYFCGIYNTN
jgi:hypothetical protein